MLQPWGECCCRWQVAGATHAPKPGHSTVASRLQAEALEPRWPCLQPEPPTHPPNPHAHSRTRAPEDQRQLARLARRQRDHAGRQRLHMASLQDLQPRGGGSQATALAQGFLARCPLWQRRRWLTAAQMGCLKQARRRRLTSRAGPRLSVTGALLRLTSDTVRVAACCAITLPKLTRWCAGLARSRTRGQPSPRSCTGSVNRPATCGMAASRTVPYRQLSAALCACAWGAVRVVQSCSCAPVRGAERIRMRAASNAGALSSVQGARAWLGLAHPGSALHCGVGSAVAHLQRQHLFVGDGRRRPEGDADLGALAWLQQRVSAGHLRAGGVRGVRARLVPAVVRNLRPGDGYI
jgi:hypothetical protein